MSSTSKVSVSNRNIVQTPKSDARSSLATPGFKFNPLPSKQATSFKYAFAIFNSFINRKPNLVAFKTSDSKSRLHKEQGSSGTIFEPDHEREIDIESDSDTERETSQERPSEYPINSLQKLVCFNSGLSSIPNDTPTLNYISSAIAFTNPLNIALYEKIVNTLLDRHRLLHTQFYLNPKIIDADVQAKLICESVIESIELGGNPQHFSLQDRLQNCTESWILDRQNIDLAFQLLVIEDTGVRYSPSAVICIASKALLDMSSVLHILSESQALYLQIVDDQENTNSILRDYIADEDEDAFMHLALNEDAHVSSEKSNSFWRAQYVEYTQIHIEESTRPRLEKMKLDGNKEQDKIMRSIKNILTQRTRLEDNIKSEKEKRIKFERLSHGQTTSFYDYQTSKTIQITPEALFIFIQNFLALDVKWVTVELILTKYVLQAETIEAAIAKFPTFEKFLEMTEESVIGISAIKKELRTLFVASETCRNVIMEAHHEHGRIKYLIERNIARLNRELITCLAITKQNHRDLMKSGEQNMTIQNTLNPPVDETTITPLSINFNAKNKITSAQTLHDSIFFVVSDPSYQRIQQYHSAAFMQSSSTKKTSLDQLDISLEIYEELGMFAICMAATCIMLKHVTGQSKFSIGVVMKLAFCRMRVGPLSPIVPIKIDLTDGNVTIFEFIKTIHDTLCQGYSYALLFPYTKYTNELCPENFNVILEFCGSKDAALYESESVVFVADSTELFDLKVSVRQCDGMKFVLRFRNDHVDQNQAERWADRILSTLDSLDFEQKYLSISSFVTRFYNEIWISKSVLSEEKISKRSSSMSMSDLNLAQE